jgi:hypothetical protein
MVESTCLKCGCHKFEVVENVPANSKFKFLFIQCSGCGGVVGVMDYYNVGQEIQNLKKKFGIS